MQSYLSVTNGHRQAQCRPTKPSSVVPIYHALALSILYKSVRCNNPTGTAIRILSHCASLNHIDSLRELGNIFRDGQYVKRSLAHALQFYKRAAALDDYRSAVSVHALEPTDAALAKVVELREHRQPTLSHHSSETRLA